MTYWQIAAGDGNTDMVQIFLKLGVALIGPGRFGDYFDNKEEYLEKGNNDKNLVRFFAEEVKIDDILVLKHIINSHKNEWEIIAIGKVVSPYRYEPIFDKVDSSKWDVQHCRRVRWWKPEEKLIVNGGGAPIRIQRLGEENEMKLVAEELIKDGIFN